MTFCKLSSYYQGDDNVMKTQRYQQGSAIVEHIIAWPILVLITLGSIQMGMLYKAKLTLNHATFQAAREGAVNYGHGKCIGCADSGLKKMKSKLGDAMAPLYLKKDPNLVSYGLAQALSRTAANLTDPIEIISPTRRIFNAFKKPTFILQCDNRTPPVCRERRQVQIPNDNLNARDTANKSVGGVRINIQDANLLKIKSSWCYPLEIPVANLIIYELSRFSLLNPTTFDSRKIACQGAALAAGALAGKTMYMIPISSTSTVQMQTPFIW